MPGSFTALIGIPTVDLHRDEGRVGMAGRQAGRSLCHTCGKGGYFQSALVTPRTPFFV